MQPDHPPNDRESVIGRTKLLMIGGALVLTSIAARGIWAIWNDEPGWSNYWGGFVYAPVAFLVVVLFVLRGVMLRRRARRAVPRDRTGRNVFRSLKRQSRR